MKTLKYIAIAAWALGILLIPAAARAIVPMNCCMPSNAASAQDASYCSGWNAIKGECTAAMTIADAAHPAVHRCQWNPQCASCCTDPKTGGPCVTTSPTNTPKNCEGARCTWNSSSPLCGGGAKPGPCCKPMPGSATDCSVALMNYSNPPNTSVPSGWTLSNAQTRCQGNHCSWDATGAGCSQNPCPPPSFTVTTPSGIKLCCPDKVTSATGQLCCQKLTQASAP